MINIQKAAILPIGLSLLLHSQAVAADGPSNATQTPPAAPAGPGTTPSGHLPKVKVIFGAITGLIVGTPVCMVRQTINEDKLATKDMTGANQEKKNVVTASTCWAPFSAVQAVLEAPFYALNNTLVNYDKPFSKEQLSLRQRTYATQSPSDQTNQAQPPESNQPTTQGK
jgi:hypothetical protein